MKISNFQFLISKYKIVIFIIIAILAVIILLSKHSFLVEKISGFTNLDVSKKEDPPIPTKVPKPSIDPTKIKALYVNSSTIYSKKFDRLVDLVKKTEVNALIIDIKDDNGNLQINDKVKNLVNDLHRENIYAIARIVVFKDNVFTKVRPEVALKTKNGALWKDNLRVPWLDPSSPVVWQYIFETSKKIADMEFDELNYDYIRFPTDNGTGSIIYPVWNGKIPKSRIIAGFSEFLNKGLKEYRPDIKLSIDIFGYAFLRKDDLNIGQDLNELVKTFDFISPMVYPSHYSTGNFNFKNPAEHPYEVILGTLKSGEEIFINNQIPITKIRPWLQVFDLGAKYDAAMIKKEKQAVYDFGVSGWLMWDPNNVYVGSSLDAQ